MQHQVAIAWILRSKRLQALSHPVIELAPWLIGLAADFDQAERVGFLAVEARFRTFAQAFAAVVRR